jgi:hypothetical protein
MGLLENMYNDYKELQKKNRIILQKKRWKIISFYVIFFGGLICLNIFLNLQKNKENEANYNWSYELACENGDFQVAHKILTKLQEEVLEKKEKEKYHSVKKEKKSHWFKDDEYVVDSTSLEDHYIFMQGLQTKARAYLAGLDYVYNAEIAYVKEMSEDDCSEKIKHLLSELRTKLLIFKSLEMEDEAQEVYNRLSQIVNGQSAEDKN